LKRYSLRSRNDNEGLDLLRRAVPKPDEISEDQDDTTTHGVAFELADSFIERYKDRATINPRVQIDAIHRQPNPPSADGDFGMSGRAEEVLLPIRVEMMNAASRPDAVRRFQDAESKKETLKISGAWRLWAEHSQEPQEQGSHLTPMRNTNPEHVFEVHPVTRVDDIWVGDTLRPIKGYDAYNATKAFRFYESLQCNIERHPESNTTRFLTGRAAYNYAEFIMRIDREPTPLQDGRAVTASVFSLKHELVVANRRMIFIKDTPPDTALSITKVGQQLHVLGVPRINLSAIRSDNLVGAHSLPYEMIIVGVYP
jgi:hypothetical protein